MIRRERSITAIVATRADPNPAARRPADAAPADLRRRRRGVIDRIPWHQVGLVASWLMLGLLIAALWGSLLLGDSLTPPVAE